MAKLNQIIAVEKGVKSRSSQILTALHHAKPSQFEGLTKTYQTINEENEKLPPESQKVQLSYKQVLEQASKALSDVLQATARKDYTNTIAKANIKIGDTILMADVPATTLLYIEKHILTDLRTFIEKLPVLDDAKDWNLDPLTGNYKTPEIQTHRTKKVEKVVVLYQATKEHPAQTTIRPEDILVGYWNTTYHSGAIPKTEKQGILERLDTLLKAVKEAREEANMVEELQTPNLGGIIFDYILKK